MAAPNTKNADNTAAETNAETNNKPDEDKITRIRISQNKETANIHVLILLQHPSTSPLQSCLPDHPF